MESYDPQVGQRHETCRMYKSFVGWNSDDHQSNQAIHQCCLRCSVETGTHDPFWTPLFHYTELDSPSYTDNSKLTGPEHIPFLFSPSHCSLSVSQRLVSVVYWCPHHRRPEPSKGRPLRLRSLVARCIGGPREAVRVLGAGGESWSSIKLSGLPSASPSGRLPQLEPGDIVSKRSSLAKLTTVSWCGPPCGPPSWAPTSSPVSPSVVLPTFLPPSWSSRRLERKLIYFMASRRISFLLSFLSGGWVGMSLRSSANAPFTFCCRQRSRLFVKIRRTIFGWPASRGTGRKRDRHTESKGRMHWKEIVTQTTRNAELKQTGL